MDYIQEDIQNKSYDLVRKARFVSILFDGSTDTSTCENELVYERVVSQDYLTGE